MFKSCLMASTLIGGLAATAPALAQDEDGAQTGDIVRVTGTRILNPNLVASSPVTSVDASEFNLSGTTRVEDLLNTLPQMAPSFDAFTVNPTTGFATADLRGLGTSRTLVLVNGQRLQPGGIRSQAPDLNQIPAAMLQRVEILTGGASAVYGSDAMAGVVNFITDRNFEGVSLTVGASGYQHDNRNSYLQGLMDARGFDYPTGNSGIDGRSYHVDFAIGSSFAGGAGHASGYVTYRRNDELLQGARDYSSCALNAAGTVCGGSAASPIPTFFFDPALMDANGDPIIPHAQDENGNWVPQDQLVGSTAANIGSDNSWNFGLAPLYNYAPINHYQRPDERWTAGAFLSYEVNSMLRPYMDFMFAHTNTSVQIAESGTFFVNRLELDCSDPVMGSACADLNEFGEVTIRDANGDEIDLDAFVDPSQPVAVYVGKRNSEGGPRISDIESNSFRLVMGSEGDFGNGWSYDVSFMYGANSSNEANRNDFLTPNLATALLACNDPDLVNTPACYNVWQFGGVTPEAAAQLGGVGMRQGKTELYQFGGFVTGDTGIVFPGALEAISAVAGFEWRRSNYQVRSDTNMALGLFTGLGGPRPPIDGGFDVTEFYAEAGVPLFANLSAELGYRYSNYNTSGGVSSYKIGLGWEPADIIRFRGGYNRAIRAPNVGELFAQQQISLWSGSDPCAGDTPTFTAAQCANTGVSAAQYGNIGESPASQYNQFSGGNPNLQPETADTWTFGFVATPMDNLSVSVDYFYISIEDRIGSIGANTILSFCGLTGDPFLCSRVNRNPNTGDLWRGSDLATSGYVENLNDNFGNVIVSGIDFNAAYATEFMGGNLGVNFNGSIALKAEIEPLPGVNPDATFDCAGVINVECQQPTWRHTLRATYDRGTWWSGSVRWRHVGSMDYENTDGTPGTADTLLVARGGELGSFNYIDLTGTFDVRPDTTLTVGVNNVMDREPPMTGSALALNANAPGGYDQNGRFLFARVNLRY
ncbi:MAG: TonB-dependent receptor [Oceanicaulis sp.]|nr:TonB-dependent receptor [Oceanicaulis sp.]